VKAVVSKNSDVFARHASALPRLSHRLKDGYFFLAASAASAFSRVCGSVTRQ
jgi:hypothetical protein